MGRFTVYNQNLTSDWDKVRKDNRQLVEDFLQYGKSSDKSPQSLYQYENWLKVFFCWNYRENNDKFFIDLKKRDFVRYIGWCRDMNMSAHRIASLKSGLSTLSNEIELLYEDEYPNFRNQIRGLEAVRIEPVREKTVMSQEQVKQILDTLVENKQYQVACYVALACSCGARKAELIQMKCDFFTDDALIFNGYMYQTPEVRAKGRGKRGKRIKKYVIKELFQPYLDMWMKRRQELGTKNEYLFVHKSENGYEQANIQTANHFCEIVSKLCHIEFYSHAARHYFCTYLKSMNLPDDVIVGLYSWATSSGGAMVSLYDDTDKSKKMEKFFENFLADGGDED